MPNPKDQRLQQLAALAQLFGMMQQQQQRQQELGQNAEFQRGQLGLHQKSQEDEASYHQGQLRNQQAATGLAQSQGDAQLAELAKYHQASIDANKSEGQNRLKLEFMQHFLADPNTSWEQKLPVLQTLDPQFVQAGQVMHEGQVNKGIQAHAPEFQAMYGQYNKGQDYPKLVKGLEALRGTMPQEVYNGQDWQGMNSGMASPMTAPQGINRADVPPDLLEAFNVEQNFQNEQNQNQQLQAQQAEEIRKRKLVEKFLTLQQMKRAGIPTTAAEGLQTTSAFGF